MSVHWASLHSDLLFRSSRLSFRERFRALARADPTLARLDTPDRVFDQLHGTTASQGARNDILRALILADRGDETDTAATVLLLALWPGLDAAHGRLRRYFRDRPDELAADLSGRATLQLRSLDLDRVTWIAATVLRNVERDIRRSLKRRWAERTKRSGDDVDDCAGTGPAQPDPHRSARELTELLTDHLGHEDALLVTGVALLGFTRREAADSLGISYAAARKRYQRALEKLRGKADTF